MSLDATPQASARAAGEEGGAGLSRRLLWLTLLRIVLVTLLLAASAMVVLRSETQDLGTVEQVLYGVIVAAYSASIVYLLLLRRSPGLQRPLAYAQVAGDVLISACLVYLTGGAESLLVFMFPLTVVSAAVLLYRRGAIVSAALSSAALAMVVVGLNAGWLPAPSPRLVQGQMPLPRLAFFLFAHTSAIFLSAALASYLAEQVRATRERLSIRESDYLALERLHESIVRSIASGIVTADRFGRITFVNEAASELLGTAAGPAVGASVEDLLPSLAPRLRGQPLVQRLEVDHTPLSGATRRLRFALSPLQDRLGKNHGWVIAFEDLTSIRAMEEAVKRSEQLAAVGAMAAGLAHELRNPLASMSGSIQLLGDSKVFADDERRLMGIVIREADRLNGLVSAFLQFARPAPPELEPVDFREVLDTTVTLFRNDPTRRGVQVQIDAEGDLTLMGDVGQLGQLLWNLLTNAAEAMPAGGMARIAARKRDGWLWLSVGDQGPGIAPGDLGHIFEPFYTTKESGTGLGLSTVHSIAQAHGGTVRVESGLGIGTTFFVDLPSESGPEQPIALRSA